MTQQLASLKSIAHASVDWLSLSVVGAFVLLLLSDKINPVVVYLLQLYVSL